MEDLILPSGRVFEEDDLKTVKQMHGAGTIRWSEKPCSLKAGGTSHVYFLGREDFTLSSALLENVALSALVRLYAAG